MINNNIVEYETMEDFLFVMREMRDEKITIIVEEYKRVKRKKILVENRINATVRIIDLNAKNFQFHMELENKEKYPINKVDRFEFDNNEKMLMALKKLEVKNMFKNLYN
jgi:hypothetical protein